MKLPDVLLPDGKVPLKVPTRGATQNTMRGDFVGTTASGDSALGNLRDGVAIVHASGNQLIGCTLLDQPSVYSNMLSGNGGNGLRITDSNDTTVHANFLGAGANNTAVVANRGDGLLASGSSSDTQVGGVIPLGDVISGNRQNGIEVSQMASGFTSFNTFAGTFAFGGAAPHRRDGILITSQGGNDLERLTVGLHTLEVRTRRTPLCPPFGRGERKRAAPTHFPP
jgi:hypothetical protein